MTKKPAFDFKDLLSEGHGFAAKETSNEPRSMKDLMRDADEGPLEFGDLDKEDRYKIVDWVEGKKGNVRALLSTLDQVLWEDSGWKPVNISQLVQPAGVKKAYMKACLIIHPDKVNGGPHEKFANAIFPIINKAWAEFKDGGGMA